MKISFPDMGSGHIFDKLFRMVGHKTIRISNITKKTLSLGVQNSPEFACIPLKVIMGSYIEAIEKGAEIIVSTGGRGPCRAGLYGEVHKNNLKLLNKETELIILDAPTFGWKKLFANLKRLKNGRSWFKVLRILRYLYKEISQLDKIDRIFNYKSSREIIKGSTKKVKQKFINQIYDCYNTKSLKKKINSVTDSINKIKEKEDFKPLKIGIIGEIFVVMEPFINFRLQEKLAEMGCYSELNQNLTHWIENHVLNNIPLFPLKYLKDICFNKLNIGSHKKENQYKQIAKNYLRIEKIGGHSFDNLKDIIRFHDEGFDAVIHLMPFACLPELVSRSIIPKLSADLDFPVLTLSIDEQTGEANVQTRIEAFIDLLWMRKIKKKSNLENTLIKKTN